MSARDDIFSRVRNALAPLPVRHPLPQWEEELLAYRAVNPTRAADPWEQFSERLRAVNGVPLASLGELAAWLEQQGCRRGYCDPALWPGLAPSLSARFTIETAFDRTRMDDYEFGITAAAGAIAETGTVILTDASTSCRLGALAPWIHVAVIRREQIQLDIPAALTAMPADPNIVWVTGPSKTADVEGILIQGVHGPGAQVVLLADELPRETRSV